jgi:hypothetical protein
MKSDVIGENALHPPSSMLTITRKLPAGRSSQNAAASMA